MTRPLAVYVLERVSKEPWLVYLRDRVFRPAGMTETELDLGASARRATGYVRAKGQIVPAPLVGAGGPVAPDVLTGLRGTALDLIRFEHALEGGRLISPSRSRAAGSR